MSFDGDTGELTRPDSLSSAATISAAGAVILLIALLWKPGRHHRLVVFAPISVALSARVWSLVVSHFVPEPYLDEFFHIPQAQKYCEGRYSEWDDKITTPPGLYLLSCALPRNAIFGALTGFYGCDAASLRAVNALALTALVYLAMLCRREIEARLYEAHSSATAAVKTSRYAAHTALNIALFPTLFFFGGLYYTDVLSTATVLAAFLHSLGRLRRDRSSVLSDLVSVLLGLLSLFMRQTNVFWVVVFLGGLEAVHAVKTIRPPRVDKPMTSYVGEHVRFLLWRYSVGDVHDPPLSQGAGPEAMIYVAFSLCVAAVCNLPRVLRQVWPHVTVLLAFAGFVTWNGGVVLGDKSNHIATIHLPQMLYIWAFFSFFSAPLLVPYALPVINTIFRLIRFVGGIPNRPVPPSRLIEATKKKNQAESSPEFQRRPSWRLSQVYFVYFSELATAGYYIGTLALSAAIVKFNTIVHPFTLADNRHYMFYVFRYTIRRAVWIRYALIVAYSIGRWLIWDTLAGCRATVRSPYADNCSNYYTKDHPSPYTNHPLFLSGRGRSRVTDAPYPVEPSSNAPAAATPSQAKRAKDLALKDDPLRQSAEPVSVSTGLIFLLAATLSLVTAPLVEPRYFIVPWVIWRLLVPAWRLHEHDPEQGVLSYVRTDSQLGRLVKSLRRYDARLILETAWFLAVNAFTAFIFLFRPYVWSAEDGTVLDGGRLQRFLW